MRVVHLASQHPADDVRILRKECRSLAAAGYEVHLVAPEAADGTWAGVRLHGFPLPKGGYRPLQILRRLWRAWRVTRGLRPRLCHFHEPVLLPVGLLSKLQGARLVYDVHEDHLAALADGPYRERWKQLGLRACEALARRVCDGFVAATPAIARSLPPERTVVVRNYALPDEFVPARSAADAEPVAVYVGVITRGRALREMVEAAGRLRDPSARLRLIGSFAPAELEQEARVLPGWSRVDYLGPLGRPLVAEHLAAARVGLVLFHPQPNHVEALPNKLFEYMAAGLPVVASDFPSWRRLLEPIGCARFVDPLDPAQIAAAIEELLADAERAREMGRRGAAAVRERFNWQAEEPELLALYARLGLTPARDQASSTPPGADTSQRSTEDAPPAARLGSR
ncbi:MAG TPA: glycosyltransferase family 4 protein [Gaiellaceae bacterium]|nr:glycosyltransferase family 4 protein [Gaiellaceae bacterium]